MKKRIIKKKYKQMSKNPIILAVIILNDFPPCDNIKDFIYQYSWLNNHQLLISCRHNPDNPDKATAICIKRDNRKYYIAIDTDTTTEAARKMFDNYPGNCAFYNVDIPTNGDLNHKYSKKFDELLAIFNRHVRKR